MKLVLTILAAEDLPRMQAFYREAFGWTQRVATPVYAEFGAEDGLRLGLYDREAFTRNTGAPAALAAGGGATSHVELYLHCDDLPAAQERITAAGARLLSPLAARSWGDEAAYYADPEGNVLVLARPLSRAAP